MVHIPGLQPSCLNHQFGTVVVLLVVTSIHPVSVKICGRKVTYLKYAATGASHSKFPDVFAAHKDKACLLFQP